jgi:hypothetical protein
MDTEKERYEKVLEMLREAKPEMNNPEAFLNKVLGVAGREKRSPDFFSLISDYLFGWVYIGWVRRSLVAVSFGILLVFIYQQSVILRRIKAIDSQVIFTSNQLMPGVNDRIDSKLLYRRAEYTLPVSKGNLSPRQVDELIKSLNELQLKYKDIIKLIEDDPDLRKYIQENLNQNDLKKLKL